MLRGKTHLVPPFELSSDSPRQNTFENLAVLTRLLLARQLQVPKGFAYDLIGDSRS